MSKVLKATPMPVYHRLEITSIAFYHGARPKKKEIAAEIGQWLLENGYIVQHGPDIMIDRDAMQYRYVFYGLKPERGLP